MVFFLIFMYNPSYAYSKSDLECLTVAVFKEARGESHKGKIAVAEVIVNRKQHPKLFPKTICGVVTQQGQFSWHNGPRSLQIKPGQLKQPKDRSAYLDAKKAAVEALEGSDVTKGSLYFVTRQASKQSWLKKKRFRVMIGQHRFYGESS
jgi:N-acetylmuramoyl-L-alanine amidase